MFLSILSLAPILGRDYLKARLSPAISPAGVNDSKEDRVSRWVWVKEWRTKVRLPSRSRTGRNPEQELEEASVAEKIQMQEVNL